MEGFLPKEEIVAFRQHQIRMYEFTLSFRNREDYIQSIEQMLSNQAAAYLDFSKNIPFLEQCFAYRKEVAIRYNQEQSDDAKFFLGQIINKVNEDIKILLGL